MKNGDINIIPLLVLGFLITSIFSFLSYTGRHDPNNTLPTYTVADAEVDKNEIVKILNERQSRLGKNKATSDTKKASEVFGSVDFVDGVALNAQGFVGLTPIDRNGSASERVYGLVSGTVNHIETNKTIRLTGFSKDCLLTYASLSITLPVSTDAATVSLLHSMQINTTKKVLDAYGIAAAGNVGSNKEITLFPIAIKTSDILRLLKDEVEREERASTGIQAGQSGFEDALPIPGIPQFNN